MNTNKFSRREFLRMSALAAAGAVVASHAGVEKLAAAPPAEEVTLEVMSLAEYEGPYQEIWNAFAATHPGIKVDVFSINEDTAAAHEAKVAGGYLPAIELTQEMQIFFNQFNYEMAVDLSSFDFPWWDRFTFDAKNAWPDIFGLPGPRSLDFFQGYVMTWMYHADLMEKAGLNPRDDVKTWDDLKKFLEEGTKWAKATPEVSYFWDQSWHNWIFGMNYMDCIPLAFPDGQRSDGIDCWLGKKKFNDPDSPYRHVYEFFKEANDKGWMPESMWTRVWEYDMEASYIAKKSVMMLHGPWPWDKALAGDPTVVQSGFPATPPAAGQDVWMQSALPPNIDNQWFMRAGVDKLPEWPQIMTAWNWFFSPEAVPMRSQAEGRWPLYRLDEPFELMGPQYQAVLKEIGSPEGKWSQVQWEQDFTGVVRAGPYRKKGSKGVWDWEANGNNEVFTDLLSGKITVQQALDIAQRNWEESFEGLPL